MDLTQFCFRRSLRRLPPLFGIAVSISLLEVLVVAGIGVRLGLANGAIAGSPSSESTTSQAESPFSFTVETPANPVMTPSSVPQVDPLNSPHPVPWNWVIAMLADRGTVPRPRMRYYRSQSLISPDGQYAAYSRIQLELSADFTQSRVASILFLENLQTGDLQTITASSPLADNPFVNNSADQPGTIAILIPVAWSETGDRILAREFESLFGSDLASDFAVVWDRQSNKTYTIAPTQVAYNNAILLGWSQTHPNQVLFRAGMLGAENWSQYAVDVSGQTRYASEDQPQTFGEIVNSIWSGPQAYMRP